MTNSFLGEKLLPCPFCGSKALLQRGVDADGEEWISLGCSRVNYEALSQQTPCLGSNPTRHPAYDEAVLIDTWNYRAPAPNHFRVEAALNAARSVVWSWEDHRAPTKTQLRRLREALKKVPAIPDE